MLVILTFLNSAGNTEAGPINVSQPLTTDDNGISEELKQLGTESSNLDQEESGIQAEASTAEEADTKVTRTTSRQPIQNPCVERYQYRIIFNRVFRTVICKTGCNTILAIVAFTNGKTFQIPYDCYRSD